jgi:hypothetical protein
MALFADVADDQKGLGSILSISSDMLTENKVTSAAAMHMVRCIWSSLFPL